MYPIESVYSLRAYEAWRTGADETRLGPYRESYKDVLKGAPWEVDSWDDLRACVSFLTTMNKRDVLYYRGQREHYRRCVPVLFRPAWWLVGRELTLNPENRTRYYALLGELRKPVLEVAKRFRTPRPYPLKQRTTP